MSIPLFRSTLLALSAFVAWASPCAASVTTLLQDDFNTEFTWSSLSETSLEPMAALVIDPADADSTSNHVLRFIRKNDARIFRDLSVPGVNGNITIEFRILKTGSTNTGGLWLVDPSGKGIGFLLELNTPQLIHRAKILSTTDAAETQTLLKVFPNIAPANPPGETVWHRVSFTWNVEQGTVSATLDGEPMGEADIALPPGLPLSRVILYGGFPSTLYLDDVRITCDR